MQNEVGIFIDELHAIATGDAVKLKNDFGFTPEQKTKIQDLVDVLKLKAQINEGKKRNPIDLGKLIEQIPVGRYYEG